MMRSLCTFLLFSIVAARAAQAGDRIQLAIHVDAQGVPTRECDRKKIGDVAGTMDALDVTIVGPAEAKLKPRLKITAGASIMNLAPASAGGTLPAALYKDEDVVVFLVGDDGAQTELCKAAGAAKPLGALTYTADRSIFTDTALRRLANDRVTGHDAKGSVLGKIYKLYHLPDGTPAFPLPSHLSEEDEIELWIVLPPGAASKVDVIACDKAPGFRVAGSYQDALAGFGKLQSGADVPAASSDPATYLVRSIGSRMKCAGTLTYKIETTGTGDSAGLSGATTTSIAIDPVYRFEWGVGYMFDFARPHALSLGDRAATSGTGSEKFVIDSNDRVGARPIITLGVNVCDANPRALDWCDRFVHPSIWLDPQRLTDGFGLGLGVRPFYGLTVVAGMTVFKSMKLADGANVEANDTWTAAGDLPTKKVFDKASLGFALAVVVSTETIAKLLP